jgi:hypothetical protein
MHITSAPIHVRAKVRVHHERAYDYDSHRKLWLYKPVGEDEEIYNLVLNAGRVQLHTFCYGTAARANGFNYIGLTNDAAAPAAGDTSLTGELTLDGLGRIQGTVTLPTGAGNVTVITKVFTYTGVSQGVRKTALFDSAVGGVMNHEVTFTPRTLILNDTLEVSFQITLG